MPVLTRRHALKLAAGAALAGVVPWPARALAGPRGCGVDCFEMALATGGTAARAAGAPGWRTLAPQRAPRRFDLVGLRWSGGRDVHAQVRARRRDGAWTRWVSRHGMGDHLPDASGGILGTEPAWTGAADLVQVRYRGRPSGLRARFVHAGPAARRSARPSARAAAAPKGQASQAAPPRIITRAEWGAAECPPRTDPSYGEVQVAFIHHTVSANEYTAADSAAIVLGICQYHRDDNKWNDLGYNFLVDRFGQVFEGRAGGIDQAVIGAQAQGYNGTSTGIACIGDFGAVAQSEAGMDALARLIAWKMSVHGVPVTGQVTVTSAGGSANRYPKGTPVTFERISGHRDGDTTACPGDALYAQLADLRARAARYVTPVNALTARASRVRMQYGTPIEVAGALRFADGASPAGRAIDVEHLAPGGTWTRVTATTIGADGTYKVGVVTPATGQLRAAFPGDGTHPRIEAPAIAVTVVATMTLSVLPRRVKPNSAISVTGTLKPHPPRIECLLERAVGSRWVVVQRKRINVRSGKFATRIRLPRPGLYRVTLTGPGASATRRVRAGNITGGASAEA